jgi:carboxymethylenebutenolidase
MQNNLYQDSLGLLNASDSDSKLPNRRLALQTALGIGYSAAAMPLMAETEIKTPTNGLSFGEVKIDVQGFKMPAFRAAPKGKTNLPVVLVISEIFGVHEYIADVACRFAREGYLAIAPELFVRQGDPSSYGEMARLQVEVISKVPDAQVMNDLDACLVWADAHGGNSKRLAMTGFCWGGRISWLYAMHQPKLKAAVAWYGRLEGQKSIATPEHPIDLVTNLKAPVLGLYGAADTGIPLESVDRMKSALSQLAAQGNVAAKDSNFVVYPDAPHAFHADYRPSYQEGAAKDGWKRALVWFKKYV